MLRNDQIANHRAECGLLPIRTTVAYIALIATAAAAAGFSWAAEPLREFKNCRLIDESWADGDSFHVRFPAVVRGSRDHVVRLYFVDCPESVARLGSDADRLQEQTRYFGLKDPLQTMAVGKEAKAFVEVALSQPFTVWTRFANARGRAAKPRIYALVIASDGKSLDKTLVRNGLARNIGVRTGLPDGTTIEQHRERLDAAQTEAILRIAGIWKHSDPMAIVPGREATLREERQRQDIIRAAQAKGAIKNLKIDPNTASPEELRKLPGIGPALANRLIENRPYQRAEDLARVPGIGKKTIENLRANLEFRNVK